MKGTDYARVCFKYDYDTLNADGKANELNEAFSTLFSASQTLSVLPILQAWIPRLRFIVSTSGMLSDDLHSHS